MPYIFLGTAIITEIIATSLLKASEGFSRLFPAIGCVIFYVICFYMFSKALLNIDLGVAYATWCAGGIVATTVISAVVFSEKVNTVGIIALIMIVCGMCHPESFRILRALIPAAKEDQNPAYL